TSGETGQGGERDAGRHQCADTGDGRELDALPEGREGHDRRNRAEGAEGGEDADTDGEEGADQTGPDGGLFAEAVPGPLHGHRQVPRVGEGADGERQPQGGRNTGDPIGSWATPHQIEANARDHMPTVARGRLARATSSSRTTV